MQNTTRLRIIVVIVTFILVVGFIFTKMIFAMINEHMKSSNKVITEYNDLFTKEAQSKLKILATVETSTRNPVSNYEYDEGFHLKVFKMNLANSDNLEKIINEKNQHANRISDVVNPLVDKPFFEMSYRTGKPDSVSKLNFTFEGDAIQRIAKNDSLACYYLKIGTFAVGYNNDPDNDIWGSAADQGEIPISVLFLKKRRSLYLIFIHVDQGTQEMAPDILYKMIKH
jgi:hypothetical protein